MKQKLRESMHLGQPQTPGGGTSIKSVSVLEKSCHLSLAKINYFNWQYRILLTLEFGVEGND